MSYRSHFSLFIQCVLVLIIVGLLTGCIDEVDGCLDNAASNFNPVADIECEDCCNFPALKINVAHRIQDTLSLSYANAYWYETPDSHAYFSISKVKFYLSNFRLERADGTLAGVIDTIDLSLQDGTQITVEDNFKLVSRDQSSFQYTIGTFREVGTYEKIRFNVGLEPPASQTNPESLTNHPLAIQSDSLFSPDNGKYIFNRITYVRDTSMMDTITIDVTDSLREIALELPESLTIERGFDVEIPVTIDYWEWLKGIVFVTNTDDIRDSIVSNTAKAFSITE